MKNYPKKLRNIKRKTISNQTQTNKSKTKILQYSKIKKQMKFSISKRSNSLKRKMKNKKLSKKIKTYFINSQSKSNQTATIYFPNLSKIKASIISTKPINHPKTISKNCHPKYQKQTKKDPKQSTEIQNRNLKIIEKIKPAIN